MGLFQCKAARPSPRECHVHCWQVERPEQLRGDGRHRQPESGQRVAREQTEVGRTDRPPPEQPRKGRTFETLPEAELKVVQGEAVGASSWLRIWSFSSLEGDNGLGMRASLSSDPAPSLSQEGRGSFSRAPPAAGDTREKSSVWPGWGVQEGAAAGWGLSKGGSGGGGYPPSES